LPNEDKEVAIPAFGLNGGNEYRIGGRGEKAALTVTSIGRRERVKRMRLALRVARRVCLRVSGEAIEGNRQYYHTTDS